MRTVDGSRSRRRIGTIALALAAVLAVPAAAQVAPGEIVEVEFTGTVSPAQIEEEGSLLFEEFVQPAARYSVDTYRIRYGSTDHDGSAAVVLAQLFVPRVEEPGERPVYILGSGTTGIADACAPSLEQPLVRRWGYYRGNMLAYAGLGYIAAFPDYLGFNDPDRPQRYFSKLAEAHVMLDTIRAVFAFFDERGGSVRPSDSVFLGGYSQGGHAAYAAADLRQEYAPEVPLMGVIGYGSTNDVETLLREGPYYAPYIFYTYERMYDDVDPRRYLQDQWAESLAADVERMCVDQFQRYYPYDGTKLYRPEFYDALYNNRLDEEYPALYRRLEENRSGLSGHGIPTLVVQGDRDIIVTTPSQREYVRKLCETGVPVRFAVFPEVRHRHTRAAGFQLSLLWMSRLHSGMAPQSDCGGAR